MKERKEFNSFSFLEEKTTKFVSTPETAKDLVRMLCKVVERTSLFTVKQGLYQ